MPEVYMQNINNGEKRKLFDFSADGGSNGGKKQKLFENHGAFSFDQLID